MQQSQIFDIVWAWLFGQGKTYKSYKIEGQPPVESGIKRADFNDIARSLLEPIIEELTIAYDWDFVFDEASTTTVANTSEYTLKGNAEDCRDIVNVRYGSGRGVVLDRLDVLQTDRREGGDDTSSDSGDVYGYTIHGRSDDGFPKIELFDTPLVAKTLTYRYRKMNLSIENFPSEFGFVIRDFMIGQFDPSYLLIARQSLNELVARYKPGGDDYATVRIDPQIEAGNIRRYNNMGGC